MGRAAGWDFHLGAAAGRNSICRDASAGCYKPCCLLCHNLISSIQARRFHLRSLQSETQSWGSQVTTLAWGALSLWCCASPVEGNVVRGKPFSLPFSCSPSPFLWSSEGFSLTPGIFTRVSRLWIPVSWFSCKGD